MKHARRSTRMSNPRSLVVVGLLAVIGLGTAFIYIPSPFDLAADEDRRSLEARLTELEAELSATQAALDAETATRAALDTEIDGLVDDLAAASEAQYESIITSFAQAAEIACQDDPEGGEASLSDVARAARCNAQDLNKIAVDLANQPVVCGVLPVEAVQGTIDRCVMLYAHSNEVEIDTLPVTASAGEGFEVVLRTSAAVDGGDTLDVSAYFRVTNELAANVGVGGHLWAYDLDGDPSRQWRIGPSNGDNVDRQRHHMPVALQTVYAVPEDWPDGHRMAVLLKADAHSTATSGSLDVDANGNLIVRVTKG